MDDDRPVAHLTGLELHVAPSAAVASLLLWSGLAIAGEHLWGLSRRAAMLGSLAAVAGHWDAVLTHHLGHALAARSTGHPMRGIALRGPLGVSLYPPDEPDLPAAIHRRRALGGAPASALAGVLFSLLALVLRRRGGAPYRVAQFLACDNLGAFALGSLLPLGFTDGSTLLRLRGRG